MHISEGILSIPVLVTGGVAAAVGTAIGLKTMSDRDMVKVAVVSSALFVATLIKVPVGPSSVHLILNGLGGILLGWQLFPAFLIALLLQAILYGFGGLSTLGVNTVILALPGVLVYALLNRAVRTAPENRVFLFGMLGGGGSIVVGAVLLSGALLTTGEEFRVLAGAVILAHVPVMIVEALVTGAALTFLRRVRPETLTLSIHQKEIPSCES